MRIGSRTVPGEVAIVAEIGNNHEGSVDVARQLVGEAAAAGVDAVKFQTFRTDRFVSRANPERFARLSSFELRPEDFAELSSLAHSLGLGFISTPLDLDSVDVLEPLVDCLKVASGDNTFYPLLDRITQTGKPVLLSAGLLDEKGVLAVVRYMRERWIVNDRTGDLVVLHCVTSYPVPDNEANLGAVGRLAQILDCPVGYSDHTSGLDAAILSVALGAAVLEKHFTLDKDFSDFRDHKLSADPAELAELVRRVRAVAPLLGSGAKVPQPSELAIERDVRRSIVAATDLARGHRVEASDLVWLRPGGGLAPGQEDVLLGKGVLRDVRAGEFLTATDVG